MVISFTVMLPHACTNTLMAARWLALSLPFLVSMYFSASCFTPPFTGAAF